MPSLAQREYVKALRHSGKGRYLPVRMMVVVSMLAGRAVVWVTVVLASTIVVVSVRGSPRVKVSEPTSPLRELV